MNRPQHQNLMIKRIMLKIKQYEAADAINTDPANLSRYELHNRGLSREKIIALKEYLSKIEKERE